MDVTVYHTQKVRGKYYRTILVGNGRVIMDTSRKCKVLELPGETQVRNLSTLLWVEPPFTDKYGTSNVVMLVGKDKDELPVRYQIIPHPATLPSKSSVPES